jgi:hypothetical protein
MKTLKRKSDISIKKLIFISALLFLLFIPYVYFGYLAFFPDLFSIVAAYWISADEKKSYSVIFISYAIALLRVIFGGNPLVGTLYILTGFIASYMPDMFKGNFPTVVILTAILTLLSSTIISVNLIIENPKTILLIFMKVVSSTLFCIIIFPFVIEEEKLRKIILIR